MAPDFVQPGEEVQHFQGQRVKQGALPGVLIGETKVWRNGKETVTEVDGLFPHGSVEFMSGVSTSPSLGSLLWSVSSSFTMLCVGLAAKLALTVCNSVRVSGCEHLTAALERAPGVPLLSVCNHHSCFDDPGVWGALLPARTLASTSTMRWGASASEVIFLNRLLASFFALGKVVPIVRGWGVSQPAVSFLGERLREGGWVNMFPEGRVTLEPPPYSRGRYRWGLGELLLSCEPLPTLLLPVCHAGMDQVLPNPQQPGEGQPCLVRPGNLVTINIGRPRLLDSKLREGESREEARARLTHQVQEIMEHLDTETRALHATNLIRWFRRWYDERDPIPSIFT